MENIDSTLNLFVGDGRKKMSDLISRQAAIAALGDIHPLDYNAQAYKARIEKLPSAQPTQTNASNALETSDCVSRQAAIDALACLDDYEEEAIETLRKLPSAQPERRGKWIYYPKASGSVTSTAVHFFPVCSECGREHPISNYCPNCGARMEEEDG